MNEYKHGLKGILKISIGIAVGLVSGYAMTLLLQLLFDFINLENLL
jgi:hypothetical protein